MRKRILAVCFSLLGIAGGGVYFLRLLLAPVAVVATSCAEAPGSHCCYQGGSPHNNTGDCQKCLDKGGSCHAGGCEFIQAINMMLASIPNDVKITFAPEYTINGKTSYTMYLDKPSTPLGTIALGWQGTITSKGGRVVLQGHPFIKDQAQMDMLAQLLTMGWEDHLKFVKYVEGLKEQYKDPDP